MSKPATFKNVNEDAVPDSYPYYWSAVDSNLTIDEFVAKYKPSMVQNDGTKPWLWVQNSSHIGGEGKKEEAVEEAMKLLAEVTENVEKIKNDDAIPTRSNKKTGAKSKKGLREQVQTEAAEKLKDIHKNYNFKSGKWLVFVPPDMVDTIWSRIAVSVAKGPLSQTVVGRAKVATTPANETSAQRVVCIYMPDVFDEPTVKEVMRILLKNHGLNLSGVKSDLYTMLGLDSKHPSGIQSTIWKNVALMKDSEIKELKDIFFAELKAGLEEGGAESKHKKVTVKPTEDDPFASDGEGSEEMQIKVKPKAKARASAADPFASSDDERSTDVPAAKQRKQVPKRRKEMTEEDGTDEEPKKMARKKR